MNGNPVDQLSDDAMAASKAAQASHTPALHQDASKKHQAAHIGALSGKRPSLAQHHLQLAALHDRHGDPTTPEGKTTVAHQASAIANASGKAPDHEAAANAHGEAADARWQDGNGKLGFGHQEKQHEHRMKAERIKNPPPGSRQMDGPGPMPG